MVSTFQGCVMLKNVPTKIPNTVKQFACAFYDCRFLSGEMAIFAEPEDDYSQSFFDVSIAEGTDLLLTGTSSILEQLAQQGGNVHL